MTYRVPMSVCRYESLALAPGHTAPYRARSRVVGKAVGLVCLDPGFQVLDLHVGTTEIIFSDDGFPSESAAKPGILFPPAPVVISQDLIANFRNDGAADIFPRAYFLVDVKGFI